MNPSGGGDATPEESKTGKSVGAAMAAKCEKVDTPSKTELKSAFSSAPDEEEIPLYPDSFDGFAELPVKADESQEKLKADKSLEIPLYPDSFDGFAELPVKCDEYQEKVKADGDSSMEMSTAYTDSLEDMTLLPVEFDNCEEILNDIEEKISKIESLKRNICEDDQTELGSPKRTKTEDGTIWAQSPNEPFRIAATIRGLLRMRNNREVQLQRMRNNREAQLRRREVMVEKREAQVEGREIRVGNREICVDKKEATLDEIKSEFDQTYAAYRSAVAADVAKNNATDPADKDSSVAQKVEKAKAMIETADLYATLGEKILSIPRRGEEVVKSYQENKEILKKTYEDNKKVASKFKGYLGAVTTTALQVARASLVETLLEMIGSGGGDVGAGGDTGAGSGVYIWSIDCVCCWQIIVYIFGVL